MRRREFNYCLVPKRLYMHMRKKGPVAALPVISVILFTSFFIWLHSNYLLSVT